MKHQYPPRSDKSFIVYAPADSKVFAPLVADRFEKRVINDEHYRSSFSGCVASATGLG